MTDVACVRCGRTAPGLDRAPLPGPLGEGARRHVCAACWAAWMEHSKMVINEQGLDLFSDEGSRAYDDHLRSFLNLSADGSPGPRRPGEAGPPPPAGYVPPRP